MDKFVGDEIIGIFVPAMTGEAHTLRAIAAAGALLQGVSTLVDGRPLPVGAGVHTGVAFVGAVGLADQVDITAMGDPVNVTARLASAAGAGEILVTKEAAESAGFDIAGLEERVLELKGKSRPTDVYVIGTSRQA